VRQTGLADEEEERTNLSCRGGVSRNVESCSHPKNSLHSSESDGILLVGEGDVGDFEDAKREKGELELLLL